MEQIQPFDKYDDDGNVFSFGKGSDGQLGHYWLSTADVIYPMRVTALQGYAIRMIAGGESFSFAISKTGDLYAWGNGKLGQLGFGEKGISIEPYLIGRNFKSVTAGRVHALALSDEGYVYSWGDSNEGVTGHGDEEDLIVPRRIDPTRFGDAKVQEIECGYFHSACVTDKGDIYTWGYGKSYCLGTNDTETARFPKKIDLSFLSPQRVTSVSCGRAHTLFLTDMGRVYGFGDNKLGQVGIDETQTDSGEKYVVKKPTEIKFTASSDEGQKEKTENIQIKSIATGSLHSFAISVSGELFAWGCGTYGQLGLGSVKNMKVPTKIKEVNFKAASVSCGERHTACITDEGHVYVWGHWIQKENITPQLDVEYHTPYQLYPPLNMKGKFPTFSEVSCGGMHTLLLTAYDLNSNRTAIGPHKSFVRKKIKEILGKVHHDDMVQLVCESFNDGDTDNKKNDYRLLLVNPSAGVQEMLLTVARAYKRKMAVKHESMKNSTDAKDYINESKEWDQLIKRNEKNTIHLALSKATPSILEAAGLRKIAMSTLGNQLRGHTDGISCLILHQNFLFTGGDDYVIRGWDILTGIGVKVFEGHSDKITEMIIVKTDKEKLCAKDISEKGIDDFYLCSCGEDNGIRVWDIDSEECIQSWTKHKEKVVQIIATGPNQICSIGLDKQAIVWDIVTLKQVTLFKKHDKPLSVACYDEHTDSIFTGDVEGLVYNWKVVDKGQEKSSAEVIRHPGHGLTSTRSNSRGEFWVYKSTVSCITVTKQYLVLAYFDGKVLIFARDKETSLFTYSFEVEHKKVVTFVTLSEDALFMFTASADCTVKMWDMNKKSLHRSLPNHESFIDFSSYNHQGYLVAKDNKVAYSGSMILRPEIAKEKGLDEINNVSYVYDYQELSQMPDPRSNSTKCKAILMGHLNYITCGDLHEGIVYTGSLDTHARSFNIRPSLLDRFKKHNRKVHSSSVFASVGDRFLYELKPKYMAPLTFFLLIVDFIQMVALPFNAAPKDEESQSQELEEGGDVAQYSQIPVTDVWRLLFFLICCCIVPLLIILFHFSTEINYQRTRRLSIAKASNIWAHFWTFLLTYVLLTSGVGFVPTIRQLLQTWNCSFMEPRVPYCFGGIHAIYISVSMLMLFFFFVLILRLAGVEFDVSAINDRELNMRLDGKRLTKTEKTLFRTIYDRWIDWSDDIPPAKNIHFMSKSRFFLDRMYMVLKLSLVCISLYFASNRLIVSGILFVLTSGMVIAILKSPPYYSRKVSAFRFSLVIGMMWCFFHTFVDQFINVAPIISISTFLGGMILFSMSSYLIICKFDSSLSLHERPDIRFHNSCMVTFNHMYHFHFHDCFLQYLTNLVRIQVLSYSRIVLFIQSRSLLFALA
eukprot:TRINITY_DN5231_c0_g1_i5.p1 TRINITY_DN5231_c0_g1~~TRINITY_DN5231_c0_g1_i5.p1  ORF type:complete len:1370 (+),score=193.14 TRINITY_DN5231_c0_g1_i5:77-4186(+)